MPRARSIASEVVAFAAFAACAPRAAVVPEPPADDPELTPAFAPVAAWRGARALADGGVEAWAAAGGALFGVALRPGRDVEALVVDDAADGTLQLFVFAPGRDQEPGDLAAHDRALRARPRIALAPALELEAADRAFAAATAARGADGWAAAFADDGEMTTRGHRVPRAAIRAQIAPLLATGALAWAPRASGVVGDRGFTVGTATFTPTSGDPHDRWRSAYLTIWERTPAGWRVRFDTGRVISE